VLRLSSHAAEFYLMQFDDFRASLFLARLSLLEGAGMRKRLKINLRLAKVCSHFPTLLLP
jgi:hypothetical protein